MMMVSDSILLAHHFNQILDADTLSERERTDLVFHILSQAAHADLPYGIAPDPASPGTLIASVDLPTGRAAWRIPAQMPSTDTDALADVRGRCQRFNESVMGVVRAAPPPQNSVFAEHPSSAR